MQESRDRQGRVLLCLLYFVQWAADCYKKYITLSDALSSAHVGAFEVLFSVVLRIRPASLLVSNVHLVSSSLLVKLGSLLSSILSLHLLNGSSRSLGDTLRKEHDSLSLQRIRV